MKSNSLMNEMKKKNREVGARLKELREQNHLTKEYVTSEIGVTRSAYDKYENGSRPLPLDVCAKLSDMLNVSIDYLYQGDECKEEYRGIQATAEEWEFAAEVCERVVRGLRKR